jgi:hypothetical protein
MKNDWSARIGDPVLLFKASQGPWVRGHPRADTYVTDGPFFHRMKNGKLVMIWSSFVKGHGYGMGQAISESGTIAGPWRQVEKPFFGGDGEDGGHAMIFRDFSGELLMVLHQPNGGNRERAKIFRLKEDGDLLVVDGPWTPKVDANAAAKGTSATKTSPASLAAARSPASPTARPTTIATTSSTNRCMCTTSTRPSCTSWVSTTRDSPTATKAATSGSPMSTAISSATF